MSNTGSLFNKVKLNTTLPFKTKLSADDMCFATHINDVSKRFITFGEYFNGRDVVIDYISPTVDTRQSSTLCMIKFSIFPQGHLIKTNKVSTEITPSDACGFIYNTSPVVLPCSIELSNYDSSLIDLVEFWVRLSRHLALTLSCDGYTTLLVYRDVVILNSTVMLNCKTREAVKPTIAKEDIIAEAKRRGITPSINDTEEYKFTVGDIKNCFSWFISVLFYVYFIYKGIVLISQFANRIMKMLKVDDDK